MTKMLRSRFVLAVQDLAKSKDFYHRVLGFEIDPIDAEGWCFLTRDACGLMLGECKDAAPAGSLGDHSYFAYIYLDDAAGYYQSLRERGVEIISELADKPWGMTEIGIRTPDGHRIMFGEEID